MKMVGGLVWVRSRIKGEIKDDQGSRILILFEQNQKIAVSLFLLWRELPKYL
jgi:hypothetical protein